jgi:hypothetical protein
VLKQIIWTSGGSWPVFFQIFLTWGSWVLTAMKVLGGHHLLKGGTVGLERGPDVDICACLDTNWRSHSHYGAMETLEKSNCFLTVFFEDFDISEKTSRAPRCGGVTLHLPVPPQFIQSTLFVHRPHEVSFETEHERNFYSLFFISHWTERINWCLNI